MKFDTVIYETEGKKIYRDGDKIIKVFDENFSKAAVLNEALNQARVEEIGTIKINKIHEVGFDRDGIVLNAGAYTHTSIAILDALRSVSTPTVEVHISNVYQREEFRRRSIISPGCVGFVGGFGLDSYRLAIEALIDNTAQAKAE